ncbi:putative FCP1-like proteiny domain-containing protein [Colletotrichum sidae]|uniref:Mitochondrial import inner membrane translocase subunit TIM50 n=2 Tax=Colletotrichum orbiculare species complex TaxID=2707354 RepID=A0A4V3HRM6_9PEZI|nr:putative FCP1-like proteiny domain-containing protein [Colletotrichum spinosum]TEA19097.1 putative FCP1-like proteiny domain-containing protein [Colletotrichum sidae]
MAAAGAPAQIGSYRIPGLGSNTPSGTFTPPAGSPSAFQQRNKSPKGIKRKTTGDPRAQMSDRDKILAPSPASGGVPEPTEAYLTRAFTPSATLPTPKPILVVMDLNGTLLHRPSRRHATSFVERPHAKRFLQYCLDTFHVVIWSSARPANVQSMCDQLLLGPSGDDSRASYRSRVLATWGRDRFGLSTADYNLRVQVYKRLDMVWDDPRVKASHPDGGVWDQSNTVLVDDSLEKARSEPYNLLPIPEFFGNASEPGLVVPQVHDYLNSLCYQSDVSSYMRENPFQVKENYKLAPPVEQ